MAARFEVFEQPSQRAFTQWTPTLLRSVLANADGGHMRQLGELCDALLGDDRIEGVFETRIGGLLGLTPTFEASGDGRRRNRAVRALEADEDWWEIAPEEELFQVLTFGRLAGFGPYQHVYTKHRGRVIPSIRFWHPGNLRWDARLGQWFTRIATSGLDAGGEVPFTPGDGQWGLYTPYGAHRPWARGLWRGLSRFWLLKSYAIDDFARLGESASKLVATAPEKANREQRKELANDLHGLGRDAAVVLPNGFDMKLVEASAATKDIYDKQINLANTAFAVNVLGQNLTTEVKEGSFAAATVHGRVENQRLKSDAQTWATAAHDQTLEWWSEFNFGDRKLAPWPIYPTDPPEDGAQTVKTWVDFGAALQAFQTAGLRVDAIAMAQKLGLPLLKEATPEDTDPGSKEERERKAAEIAAQNTPPEPERDPNAGTTDPKGERDDAAQARYPRLASGDDPRLAAGYVDGQLYADRLADRSREHGAQDLSALLEAVEDLIDGAESLEDAESRLVELYRDRDIPPELHETLEAMIQMAHRAGIGAVQADTPEHEFTGDNDAAG